MAAAILAFGKTDFKFETFYFFGFSFSLSPSLPLSPSLSLFRYFLANPTPSNII
jgi:hypothetical protein